jgi:hypothetical protein
MMQTMLMRSACLHFCSFAPSGHVTDEHVTDVNITTSVLAAIPQILASNVLPQLLRPF